MRKINNLGELNEKLAEARKKIRRLTASNFEQNKIAEKLLISNSTLEATVSR